MPEKKISNRFDVIEMNDWYFCLRQRNVGRYRDDVRVIRVNKGLVVLSAVNFQLRKSIALEALDQHEVDRRHLGNECAQVPFALLAKFVQDGPALCGRNNNLGRAGRAVEKGILAWLIQIEAVMGVLEGGYLKPARDQTRN